MPLIRKVGDNRLVKEQSNAEHSTPSLINIKSLTDQIPYKLTTDDIFNDFVVSGFLPPTSGSLDITIPIGEAYAIGVKVGREYITQHTFTASKDTYVDIDTDNEFHYQEVNNGASSPSVWINSIRLFNAISDGTAVIEITDLRQLGVQINKDLEIDGDFIVQGTTIQQNILDVTDKNISVNKSGTGDTGTAEGAGLSVVYDNQLTGTVTVANGSMIVTGASTLFIAELSIGGDVKFGTDTERYVIDTIDSTTQITLTTAYQDVDQAGIAAYVNTVLADFKYDSTLASKFKIGLDGAEKEIIDVSSIQTLTNKTLQDILGPVTYDTTNLIIRANTSDGTDDSSISITGGGGLDYTRGSYIISYGNEHSTKKGDLDFHAGFGDGTSDYGQISFDVNGGSITSMELFDNGVASVPILSFNGDIQFNRGGGQKGNGSDIFLNTDGVIASEAATYCLINADGSSTDSFYVKTGSEIYSSATELFRIDYNGVAELLGDLTAPGHNVVKTAFPNITYTETTQEVEWRMSLGASGYMNYRYNDDLVTPSFSTKFSMRPDGDMYSGSDKFWHEGNDGSGSTLDADTLDTYHYSDITDYVDGYVKTLELDYGASLAGDTDATKTFNIPSNIVILNVYTEWLHVSANVVVLATHPTSGKNTSFATAIRSVDYPTEFPAAWPSAPVADKAKVEFRNCQAGASSAISVVIVYVEV
ncbi:MAG: hypothetical protein KAS32_03530 [Candidatus Peribacteraceae bacterium]|nr:hypothetical protein [Candidatus Peribacteraceae bacterium]